MNNILILGANSDMAVALARIYAANKNRLMLAGRDTSSLEVLKNDLSIRNLVEVSTHEFDACNFAQHQSFYDNLPVKPDITICVFGYLGDQDKAQTDWLEAKKIIDTNYTGAASILNIIANHYEFRKHGTIVGISSVAGERGRQSNYLYGSAKAAFTAYLSGLRNRLFKSNVHVMTVKPGFVRTKMTEGLKLPKPLTADPEQVAKAIFNGIHKKKDVVYVLSMWGLIMLVIKIIPESIFKKMKL